MTEKKAWAKLLVALGELVEIVPDMRAGQVMAAVGALCADLHGRGLWDATDAELPEAAWQFCRNFQAAPHATSIDSQKGVVAMVSKTKFRVRLWADEDGGFAIAAPVLPGCWSQGDTKEEALENIKDATEEYLASANDDLQEGGINAEVEVCV